MSRKSKKDRQYQMTKRKNTNNDLLIGERETIQWPKENGQTMTYRKLKIDGLRLPFDKNLKIPNGKHKS